MTKYLFAVFVFWSTAVYAQPSLKQARTSSWHTIVYKVTATQAEQFIKWDSIPIAQFENTEPVAFSLVGAIDTDTLPFGHYVELRVVENKIQAWLFNNTNIRVITINNKKNTQLDVQFKDGNPLTNSTAFFKGKQIPFNTNSKTFWVKQRKLDEGVIKICTPGDTTFIGLAEKNGYYNSIRRQRWQNFRTTKIYKILNLLPSKIKQLTKQQYSYKSNRIGATGYIIFNQPKYKPLDTVRYKGYVINKKGKQYQQPVHVYLQYYGRGKQVSQLLQILKPVTDGAFVGEFILADTIPSDIKCILNFSTSSKKEIIKSSFKIEDYLLDDMGSFSFSANKENLYKSDSSIFTASSKDANGLNVLDASATLILTTSAINKFYKDTLFVKDTLYREEKKLSTTTDTKFTFFAANLPNADLEIDATLIFKNSNNETHEEKATFSYIHEAANIIVQQLQDTILATLFINGQPMQANGKVEMNDELEQKIHYPYKAKINPVAEDYTFYYTDSIKKVVIDKMETIRENYTVQFSPTSSKDTLGFVLRNPYKIPVYYTVFFGKQIITTGKDDNAIIVWQKKMNQHKRSYKVRWQYIWAGIEKQGEDNVGLFYKLLDVKINTSETVFPGQRDSIKVVVKDYMGKPAANVNLTAVSYNNQFNNDIKVPAPPYLAKYKGRKYLQYDGFENDGDVFLSKKYDLGKNKNWIQSFNLYTMAYYQLLFPKNGMYDAVTLIENVMPQISVNVVDKGVPQEIYLLYINRQLVYFNGTTVAMPYSFETMPENVKLGIRLRDKFIEIDSLYIQPHYKHDISFDINNLPVHSVVTPKANYWNNDEMNQLENSLMQMQADYNLLGGYLWQFNKVVRISDFRNHIIGPFDAFNTTTYFNPNSFDIQFNFEPGYQYSLSKQVTRLEKKSIFPRRDILNYLPNYTTTLKLGDTIQDPPKILFTEKKLHRYLRTSYDLYKNTFKVNQNGIGAMQFNLPKDSTIKYVVLQPQEGEALVISDNFNYTKKVKNIIAGKYNIYFVTPSFYTATLKNIFIKKNGTTCVNIGKDLFEEQNSYINALEQKSLEPIYTNTMPIQKDTTVFKLNNDSAFTTNGGIKISGSIKDKKGGYPIVGASIIVKGTKTGTITDILGNFSIANLRVGKHTLVVASVGYSPKEIIINVSAGINKLVEVKLSVSSNALDEVVVIGYGTSRKKDLTGSIATISRNELSFNSALQGKVAGLSITGREGVPGADAFIRLRGLNSFNSGNPPLYVIDGIIYDKLPSNINPDDVVDYTILKDAAATALYGARAANGVVVLTTSKKTFRTTFRDYAFWKPNFFTDKNGTAAFEVEYPDNITGWRTFVVGMDKKRRGGKASILTQAYKPLVAQLAVPQFLIEGDTAFIIAKAKNYTDDNYNIKASFKINDLEKVDDNKTIAAKQALNQEFAVSSNNDTLTIAYQLETTTGFKDGEEKKIPVFKKGIEETTGAFWVLQTDTTINYKVSRETKQFTVYAQNNTLDVLLDEIEHLKQYPYYCMEQTASKLIGYAMERTIKDQLAKPFSNEKEINKLLSKLQKAQQFDGGWAWWESGKSNFYITNYVANALLPYRENSLVETNVRNAFLFLQNQLPRLKKDELLAALVTLNNGKHQMNFEEWMKGINYDSLNQHQQWQWVKVMQGQKLNYDFKLQELVNQQIGTMLGGVHWGNESYNWYSNNIATTVLAFEVLKNENKYQYLLQKIIQYFLGQRRNRYWRNTVESASILNAILPTILKGQSDFTQNATLSISGDTSLQITTFPYQLNLKNTNIKNWQVSKTGGGIVYFTLYEKRFNPSPERVDSNFNLTATFEKNGQVVSTIKAGEKIIMKIKVDVKADAEFIMMQVPIPAGCNYATKKSDWATYREYYKDKMMLFTESLSKGVHYFEIELEPRYKGNFTLNPAKMELMYFPIFYGRNEMKRVEIVDDSPLTP